MRSVSQTQLEIQWPVKVITMMKFSRCSIALSLNKAATITIFVVDIFGPLTIIGINGSKQV